MGNRERELVVWFLFPIDVEVIGPADLDVIRGEPSCSPKVACSSCAAPILMNVFTAPPLLHFGDSSIRLGVGMPTVGPVEEARIIHSSTRSSSSFFAFELILFVEYSFDGILAVLNCAAFTVGSRGEFAAPVPDLGRRPRPRRPRLLLGALPCGD